MNAFIRWFINCWFHFWLSCLFHIFLFSYLQILKNNENVFYAIESRLRVPSWMWMCIRCCIRRYVFSRVILCCHDKPLPIWRIIYSRSRTAFVERYIVLKLIVIVRRTPNSCNEILTKLEPKQLIEGSWDSVVGITTGYELDDRGVGVRVPVGSRIFPSPCRPDRLCGPPSLLSNGYRGLVPRG
jgi:hypothetical protein